MRASDGAGQKVAEGEIELPFVLPTGLIIGGVIVLVLLVSLLAVVGWWVWRRVRRSGLLERSLLQVRVTALPAGTQRDIAELRLGLHTELEQTRRVVSVLGANTAGPQLLADLLTRLQRTTTGLDAHLRLLQGEPDQGYLADTLPTLRVRVDAVHRDALTLRRAALRLHADADDLQRTLAEQDLRDAVAGLEAGMAEIRALQPPTDPGGGPSSLPPGRSEGRPGA
jgi:hypothetical protein